MDMFPTRPERGSGRPSGCHLPAGISLSNVLLIIHMGMIAAILVPIHSNNYYIAFVRLTNYYPLSM